jgi:predicted Holliday junction resolvase-like endonuclease
MDGISGIITVFSIVAAFYGALLTVFMLILSALWLRMGNVQQELGGVRASVRLLQEEMHRSQDEFREEMRRSQDEFREEMRRSQDEFREEMRRSQDELREDFQRSHNQLMRAILAHSHRDDGRPTFDLPPDFEPTPADD